MAGDKKHMKKILLATVATAALIASPASAMTLRGALEATLESSPQIAGARAQLEQAEQGIYQARSGFLPQVTAEGEWADSSQEAGGNEVDSQPRTYSIALSQPLFNGGTTRASYLAQKRFYDASFAALENTEQQVLYNAAQAYMAVLRDIEILDLNNFQVEVLERQLEATNTRFELGDVTRTDVSQAQARLAAAKAAATQAEGVLTSSKAMFQEVVGIPAGDLDWPDMTVQIPSSWQSVESKVLDTHPLIQAAVSQLSAQDMNVDAARGDFLPDLTANASYQKQEGISGFSIYSSDEVESQVLSLNLSVPLFRGGQVKASYNSAKAAMRESEESLRQSQRQVRSELVDAFNAFKTVRARLRSLEDTVKASSLALEGVENEANVGSRTVLDVLDARQELLQAQVDLTSARSDVVSTTFRLIAAMGQLTADDVDTLLSESLPQ